MGRFTFTDFVSSQWATAQPVVTTDLTGKTILITGANAGIGFEASKHFARMNPGRLIWACRSQEKGEAALAAFKTETGYERAELWLVDLASFSSVKSFVNKFDKDGGRLDYLILNAGVMTTQYQPTKDGCESSLQVNCLSTSLLALLLLPHMIETARRHSVAPRLVVVSSEVHYWTSFDQQVRDSDEPLRLLGSEEYSVRTMNRRYMDTKLLNVFFVRALAKRLSNVPVIVNAVNPGFCRTGFRRSLRGPMAMLNFLMELFLVLPAEVGSRQLVWGALGGRDEEVRGGFVHRSRITEISDFALSEKGQEMQEKIWTETLDILGKIDSRILKVVTEVLPRD